MTIRDVVMAVRQRWWALVGCVVLGGAAGLGIAVLPAPTYSSVARVVVAVPDVQQNSLQLPGGLSVAQRAINYQTLATSNEVLQGVIDKLKLTTSVAQLTREVKVDVPLGTTVLQITAAAGSAADAQHIAEGVAEQLAATANRLEKGLGVAQAQAVLSVADPAPLPQSADKSGALSKTALGIIAGLIVGAGLLWLLEYLDGSVRKPEDLADVTNAPVLSSVMRVHSGPVPASGPAAEPFRTMRTALSLPEERAAVVVVAGVSASDDAAPVAANLAAAQARTGRRTLLVDADPQSAALGTLLGLPRGRGLADSLTAPAVSAPETSRWEAAAVDVLTAGTADGPESSADLAASPRAAEVLGGLRSAYDVIIVSAPAALASVAAAALGAAADGVILVATWGSTSLAAASHARDRVTMASGSLAGSVLVDVPRYRRDADFVPAPR